MLDTFKLFVPATTPVMNICNIQLSFSSLRTICFLEHISQNRITGPRGTNLCDCGHKLPNNVPKGLLPTYSATSSECFSVSRQPTVWALGFPFVFVDLIGEKYTFVTFEYALPSHTNEAEHFSMRSFALWYNGHVFYPSSCWGIHSTNSYGASTIGRASARPYDLYELCARYGN